VLFREQSSMTRSFSSGLLGETVERNCEKKLKMMIFEM